MNMNIEQARINMVDQQIKTWEVIGQNILSLLKKTNRENFLPANYHDLSFADISIQIGNNQTTMPPKLEARIIQILNLKGDESILEVGTGCGYLTSLLAHFAKSVKSIDIFPDFIEKAKTNISKLELNNVELECVDIYSILNKQETYDVVILTGSIPEMDKRFLDILNKNGKIFAVIGEKPIMEACIITKENSSKYSCNSIFETSVPSLIGAEKKEKFNF